MKMIKVVSVVVSLAIMTSTVRAQAAGDNAAQSEINESIAQLEEKVKEYDASSRNC